MARQARGRPNKWMGWPLPLQEAEQAAATLEEMQRTGVVTKMGRRPSLEWVAAGLEAASVCGWRLISDASPWDVGEDPLDALRVATGGDVSQWLRVVKARRGDQSVIRAGRTDELRVWMNRAEHVRLRMRGERYEAILQVLSDWASVGREEGGDSAYDSTRLRLAFQLSQTHKDGMKTWEPWLQRLHLLHAEGMSKELSRLLPPARKGPQTAEAGRNRQRLVDLAAEGAVREAIHTHDAPRFWRGVGDALSERNLGSKKYLEDHLVQDVLESGSAPVRRTRSGSSSTTAAAAAAHQPAGWAELLELLVRPQEVKKKGAENLVKTAENKTEACIAVLYVIKREVKRVANWSP